MSVTNTVLNDSFTDNGIHQLVMKAHELAEEELSARSYSNESLTDEKAKARNLRRTGRTTTKGEDVEECFANNCNDEQACYKMRETVKKDLLARSHYVQPLSHRKKETRRAQYPVEREDLFDMEEHELSDQDEDDMNQELHNGSGYWGGLSESEVQSLLHDLRKTDEGRTIENTSAAADEDGKILHESADKGKSIVTQTTETLKGNGEKMHTVSNAAA